MFRQLLEFKGLIRPLSQTRCEKYCYVNASRCSYVMGCFAVYKLENYFVRTNEPIKQDIAYLHFHLIYRT